MRADSNKDSRRTRDWAAPSIVTIALVLAAVLCGAVGYWQHAAEPRWDDVLVRTVRLFSLDELPPDANALIRAGRILGVVVLSRALLAVYLRFTRERWAAWRIARMANHVVVFGLGQKGLDAALAALADGKQVVIVEKEPAPFLAEQAERAGARLLVADATDCAAVAASGIRAASEIIAVCGEDAVNFDIVLSCATLRANSPAPPLRAVVHLRNLHLRDALIRQDWLPALRKTLDLSFVNFADNTARAFVQNVAFESVPGTGPVHLIIIGFDPVGQAIAIHAARLLHFADGEKPRITIIAETTAEIAAFRARWPFFEAACHAAFHDIASSAQAAGALSHLNADERAGRISIVVTAATDEQALALGLSTLRARPVSGEYPLHIHQTAASSAVTLLRKSPAGSVQIFGELDERFDAGAAHTLDARARIAHERYLAVAQQNGAPLRSRASLFPWEDLSEEYRNATRAQADHIPIKLRVIGLSPRGITASHQFTADQIEHLSRMEHSRWCADRLLAGWTPGSPRDDAAKKHPSLVPYDALPESEKEKDREAIRSIPSLL